MVGQSAVIERWWWRSLRPAMSDRASPASERHSCGRWLRRCHCARARAVHA
jgi:hypothetical protein